MVKNLAVFLTKGMSLHKWNEIGIIDRELKIYHKLARKFNKIYILSYGYRSELRYKKNLPANIEILYKKNNIADTLYQFMIPFIYKNELKSSIMKTNQMNGSLAAVISRLLYKNPLVIRTGYTWSLSYAIKKQLGEIGLISRIFNDIRIPLIEMIAYKNSDIIIVSAKYDKKYIQTRYKVPGKKIRIVRNYIDTALFKPKQAIRFDRALYIGRLEKQKNLFRLLTAAKISGIGIDLLGQGSLLHELKKEARKSRIDARFLGTVPNKRLPLLINKYEIFILPTLWEGMPKALLEAMSCGLACIGTDVKGTREVIQHRKNGVLCKTSAKSISAAILQLNPSLKKKLGSNARNYIVANFDIDVILKKELRIYNEL